MSSTTYEIQTRTRFAMPVSGHPCALRTTAALGTTDRVAGLLVSDMAVSYKAVSITGAFPGPDAWSPPI